MAPEEALTGDLVDDDGDEALRQIENELAVVEEAMAERQRSLVEVDQRLNDLQATPSCTAAILRPVLDPVAEAAAEEVGTTPLRNSRAIGSGVVEVAAPTTNGDAGSGGLASPDKIALSQKTVGAEEGVKSDESAAKAALKPPRSAENLFNTIIVQPALQPDVLCQTQDKRPVPAVSADCLAGASGSNVARMYSVPARVESTTPRPPRPLVISGSLRGRGSCPPEVQNPAQPPIGTRKTVPAGTTRSNLFSYPGAAVASNSPWRGAPLPQQQKANGSSDSLSRGPSTTPATPATPRGSSMPPEARPRIFSAQSTTSTQASGVTSTPSVTVGMGQMGSLTPRLPMQAVRASAPGYPAGSTGVSHVIHLGDQLDTSRARSISAGPMSTNVVPGVPGNLSPRQVTATPFSQYGNRFSAVTPSPQFGMAPIRSASAQRTTTPQPTATAACRFVPVSAQGFVEVQRGRECSQGPGPQRAPSVTTARGGSTPPGVAVAPSAAVVRQSSVARPASSGAMPVRQVSGPSTSTGSCTPAAGASVTTVGAAGASCSASANEDPQASSYSVGYAAAAAASAARSLHSNARHSLGASVPGNSTPQPPSRYAYVNSTVRRDCASNPRDMRHQPARRGRT